MELLLNAAWLVIGGALAISVLRRRTADDHTTARVLLALACAMILLFPVISMTDDLYAQQFAIEDASAAKKLAHAGELANAFAVCGAAAVTAAYSLSLPAFQARRSADNGERLLTDFAVLRRIEGRAPPLL